jgi:hypothetical protein
MMKFFFHLVIISFLSACATVSKPHHPLPIPDRAQKYLSSCRPLEGSFSVRAFEGSTLIFAGEFDWASTNAGWRTEFLDPTGRTYAALSYDHLQTRLLPEGMSPSFTEKVEVRPDGFIYARGHFIGVRASEVPCLLVGRVPRMWNDLLYHVEDTEKGLYLGFSDGKREIKVSAPEPSAKNMSVPICTEISWYAMLGFSRRRVEVCVDTNPYLTGTLNIMNDYSLKWTDLERGP